MNRDAEAFILANTAMARPKLVPEIALALATEITPIWQASEAFIQRERIEPPFWAFAWPGAQALARMVLDRPSLVVERRVLDFAAGSGLAAIACALSGAAKVDASELDPLAVAAIGLNARANAALVSPVLGDLVGAPPRWDLILCGDICYEATMTAHVMPWLTAMAARGCAVWVADPGRAYLPHAQLDELDAVYDVPTSLELEDRAVRPTKIYQVRPGSHSTGPLRGPIRLGPTRAPSA